jgi:hypothetical protein
LIGILLILKLYTISRNGRLNVWECDTPLNGLIKSVKEVLVTEGVGQDSEELVASSKVSKKKATAESDDDDDLHDSNEKNEELMEKMRINATENDSSIDEDDSKISYIKKAK